MAIIPIYIPTYISDQNYSPSKVLPRLLFFNGMLDCEEWYIESGSLTESGVTKSQLSFPYFDNYNVVTGSFPTTGSKSLLFNNENTVYGNIPNENLYTEYWEKYISLLYNPYTRLINANAIIPLADYFKMELNDIVNFRGNYYHLRAINDYSLKDGSCNIQLLGPIIKDTISFLSNKCYFNAEIQTLNSLFRIKSCDNVTELRVSFTSSLSMSVGQSFTWPNEAFAGCWYVSSSYSGETDLDNVEISQSYVDCATCQAANPTTTTTTTTSTTTTTTTLAPPVGNYNYYAVASNCCSNTPSENIIGVVAVSASAGTLLDGQTIGSSIWTGSNGIHCISVKYATGSTTPLLFILEESQFNSHLYGLGQCNSCNRDYIPTPPNGVCLDFSLTNAAATIEYINCSGSAVTQSVNGGTLSFCTKTVPNITYSSYKPNARLAVDCDNCGTY